MQLCVVSCLSHPTQDIAPSSDKQAALLWTHYHATTCRLFEPVIYVRSASVAGGHDAGESTARTAALWQCLHSAREFFSAYTAVSPQNIPCMPFYSVHLSFCAVTAVKLLFLGDEISLPAAGGGPGAAGAAHDPDWNASLAREALGFEALSVRLGDFFDEADRLSGGPGRRARYVDHERTVLSVHRDKIRWMHNWYVARTRPGAAAAAAAAQGGPPARWPTSRPRVDGGGRGGGAQGAGAGAGAGAGSGGGGGGGEGGGAVGGGGGVAPAAHYGQGMDVDYGVAPPQSALPGDLDDVFWQAMFDWGWNGGADLMEIQA